MLLRQDVEEVVAAEVQARDPEQLLPAHEFSNIVGRVANTVCARMVHVQHSALDEEDRAFIRRQSLRMVQVRLHPGADQRFGKRDRVVCRIAGRRSWAPGTITELDHDDPDDPTGQTQLPYLVKIDPPNQRVICVPRDCNTVVRAEVCFGQRPDALFFSLFCKPPRKQTKPLRFGVGARVACIVEDDTGDDITWAAGTVLEVNYDAGPDARKAFPIWDWPCSDGAVPYRVRLDTGGHVLVHRDEHWLVRDLRLQPACPRQVVPGAQSLPRFTRRQEGDARLWTPQQTGIFPRQFQARALATLCAAYRLRTHPPPGAAVSLGDLPSELLLGIISASAGKELIDHATCQIRVESGCDSDDE